MSNKSSTVKVPAVTVVVKKGSTLKLLNTNVPHKDLLLRCIKAGAVTKDQVIYKSLPGDFLRGEFPNLTLINRFNVFDLSSSTVAKFTTNDGSGSIIEKNSHEVSKLIGQKNYNTIFSALCSVINQELRIRSLLALLTIERSKYRKEVSAQTEKSYANSVCQTDETSKNILENFRQRRRVKRQQFRPYFLKTDDNKLKRVVVDPKPLLTNARNCEERNQHKSKDNEIYNPVDGSVHIIKTEINDAENATFPELSAFINEDSNFSDTSIGNISLTSQHSVNLPQLLDNPNTLINNIDNHTEALMNIVPLTLLDGSEIMVCAKPADKFHWATSDIMKNLSYTDQSKLLYQQAFIHWKYCLEQDEDGYLPIHNAVMSNDVDFLKHQCSALNKKYGTVDVPAVGNMTALQMSIYKGGEQCTALLLQNGADPCHQNDDGQSFFHTAAEVSHEHLKMALDHCKNHAQEILKEDEDLWNPIMENQPDEQLAKVLLDHICITCDSQGYTPLMLASKLGNYFNVKLLLEASPGTINRPMPTGGSTALYLAVEAACIEAANSKNQTKISENFLKTIEILMEFGGDPSLENHLGSSVNILLMEFNIVDLSVLIANKLTSVKYFDGNSFAVGNINSLMLFKNRDGKVDLTEIRCRRAKGESKDVSSASTSGVNKTDKNIKNTDNNVNIDIDKKRNNLTKASKCKYKQSKVEITDIKTIKPKCSVGGPAPSVRLVGPPAVNVKPSHFIIVPKVSKLSQGVPKYVKIWPKLDQKIVNKTDNSGLLVEADTGSGKTGATRKHKQNAGSEQTSIKKQRKETQHWKRKKSNECSNTLDGTDTSDRDIRSKDDDASTTE